MAELVKYKLVEKLGEGTFANVYKVVDQAGHQMAFKKYRVGEDPQCSWFTYFLREISAISTLGVHPNIVSVDRVIFKPKLYALTMELMDGTVYEFFQKLHSSDIKEQYIKEVASQILQALSHMERHRFAHRDIKGDNILYKKMEEDQIVFKLSDFNLTRSTGREFYSGEVSCLIYRAPELWSISKVGEHDASKVDIWGLGSTLYVLLVGDDGVAPTHNENFFFRYWSSVLDMSAYMKNSTCEFIGLEQRILDEFPKTNPLLIDFLTCLLKPNPLDRVSAQEALNHPFLDNSVTTKHYDLQWLTPDRFDWTTRYSELVPRHRMVLIDWLYDVSKEHKHQADTFHTGIQFLDVYMQMCTNTISTKQFQLVGCAAFCLATHLLEFRPMSPLDWSYFTEYAYNANQILDFTTHMFQTLGCKLPPPQDFDSMNLEDIREQCLVFPMTK